MTAFTATTSRLRSSLVLSIAIAASLAAAQGCGDAGTSSGGTNASSGGSGTSSGNVGGGGDGGGAGANNTNVSADEACTRYVEATVLRNETCFPRTYVGLFDEGTRAVNLAYMKSKCLSTFAAEGSVTTPTDIATCADTLNALSCGDIYFNSQPYAELDQSFRCALPRGKKPAGNSCSVSAQCKGYCKRSEHYIEEANGKCGVCVDYVADGESCLAKEGAPPCLPSSYCGDTGKCEKLPAPFAQGETCEGRRGRCKYDLFCSDLTKKCEPRPKAGAACRYLTDCEADYVCDDDVRVCVHKAVAGEKCQRFGASGGHCAAGFFCTGAGANSAGTCAAITSIEPGDACFPANGKRCRIGRCSGDNVSSGQCIQLAAKGEACSGFSSRTCDVPYTCLNGTCIDPGPPTCK